MGIMYLEGEIILQTDIQIAQGCKMQHIADIAKSLGIDTEDLEFYGKYKAKLSDKLWDKVKDKKDGKLVLVTAINQLLQVKERLLLQ